MLTVTPFSIKLVQFQETHKPWNSYKPHPLSRKPQLGIEDSKIIQQIQKEREVVLPASDLLQSVRPLSQKNIQLKINLLRRITRKALQNERHDLHGLLQEHHILVRELSGLRSSQKLTDYDKKLVRKIEKKEFQIRVLRQKISEILAGENKFSRKLEHARIRKNLQKLLRDRDIKYKHTKGFLKNELTEPYIKPRNTYIEKVESKYGRGILQQEFKPNTKPFTVPKEFRKQAEGQLKLERKRIVKVMRNVFRVGDREEGGGGNRNGSEIGGGSGGIGGRNKIIRRGRDLDLGLRLRMGMGLEVVARGLYIISAGGNVGLRVVL